MHKYRRGSFVELIFQYILLSFNYNKATYGNSVCPVQNMQNTKCEHLYFDEKYEECNLIFTIYSGILVPFDEGPLKPCLTEINSTLKEE